MGLDLGTSKGVGGGGRMAGKWCHITGDLLPTRGCSPGPCLGWPRCVCVCAPQPHAPTHPPTHPSSRPPARPPQVPLVFRSDSKRYVDTLQPGEVAPYAWDEPTLQNSLRVQVR